MRQFRTRWTCLLAVVAGLISPGCSSLVHAPELGDVVRVEDVETVHPQPVRLAALEQVEAEGELPEGASAVPRPLNQRSAVQIALERNAELKAARREVEAALQRIPQVSSLPDPSLTIAAFVAEIQTAAGQQELVTALSQRFPWFEKLVEEGNAEAARAASLAARYVDTQLRIEQQARVAYLEVFFYDRSLEVLRSLERLIAQQLIPDVREKVRQNEVGLETLYEAEVELEDLRNRIVDFEEARRGAVARLLAVLNLPEDTEVVTAETLEAYELEELAELLPDARQNHPQVSAARYLVDLWQHKARVADLGYVPDVTLGTQWSAISSSGISPVANGRDAVAVTVGVNLPIQTERIEAARLEARAEAARAAHLVIDVQQRVVANLSDAYARLRAARAQRERIEQEILPRLRESIDLARVAYRVNRIEFEQYVQLWRELIDQEVRRYREMTDEHEAAADIRRWSGQ